MNEKPGINAEVPIYRKYTIGVEEAASYYSIGEKKIRQLVAENPFGDFYLEIGRHILIKRPQFENFLAKATSL